MEASERASAPIIDISLAVGPEMLVWPGDPGVRLEPVLRLDRGDGFNVSELSLGTHTGTHVDPPSHFLGGGTAVDQLPLEVLVGPALVADLTRVEDEIGLRELASLDLEDGIERLLFKTRNSQLWERSPISFPQRYVGLSPEGARWVAERGIRLVGMDFLSIEPSGSEGYPTHLTLLEAGVIIVEGLDLGSVEPGHYMLACLPLRLTGGDGAPARAALIRDW
ncbi:MAG: cyclase family protein [Actinomycetota bacterium]